MEKCEKNLEHLRTGYRWDFGLVGLPKAKNGTFSLSVLVRFCSHIFSARNWVDVPSGKLT